MRIPGGRRGALVGALAVVALVGGIVAWRARGGEEVRAAVSGDTTRAPAGERIVVEVYNASGTPGMARRATFLLRDRGFDVVGWGNDKERREATLVVDHTAKGDAASRVARVLGGATVERGEASPRWVDVTVHLGRGFTVPAGQPFHP